MRALRILAVGAVSGSAGYDSEKLYASFRVLPVKGGSRFRPSTNKFAFGKRRSVGNLVPDREPTVNLFPDRVRGVGTLWAADSERPCRDWIEANIQHQVETTLRICGVESPQCGFRAPVNQLIERPAGFSLLENEILEKCEHKILNEGLPCRDCQHNYRAIERRLPPPPTRILVDLPVDQKQVLWVLYRYVELRQRLFRRSTHRGTVFHRRPPDAMIGRACLLHHLYVDERRPRTSHALDAERERRADFAVPLATREKPESRTPDEIWDEPSAFSGRAVHLNPRQSGRVQAKPASCSP